jgi:hypothetical protein
MVIESYQNNFQQRSKYINISAEGLYYLGFWRWYILIIATYFGHCPVFRANPLPKISGGRICRRLYLGRLPLPPSTWAWRQISSPKGGYTLVTLPRTVTLQVTDTIRSYDLKFHPMPHGVTVSCERCTMGFPVCYGNQMHHECKEGERSWRWWRVTLYVQTYSGRNRIPFDATAKYRQRTEHALDVTA